MGREELEVIKRGIVKRRIKRRVGLFINGVGLDRATRRLEKKVDISRLVSGMTSGLELEVARYYTLVPYEDDARQLAFLDAVSRAGLEVITKRLPPKGVMRQVSMDVHMATDLINYCFGSFAKIPNVEAISDEQSKVEANTVNGSTSVISRPVEQTKRLASIVCPGRELSYAIFMANSQGVETTLGDFGLYGQSDGWSGVDHWVDLSTSETIWRD
jgi:hypothetical protein